MECWVKSTVPLRLEMLLTCSSEQPAQRWSGIRPLRLSMPCDGQRAAGSFHFPSTCLRGNSFFFLAMLRSLQDLSSLTRDIIQSRILITGPLGNFQVSTLDTSFSKPLRPYSFFSWIWSFSYWLYRTFYTWESALCLSWVTDSSPGLTSFVVLFVVISLKMENSDL